MTLFKNFVRSKNTPNSIIPYIDKAISTEPKDFSFEEIKKACQTMLDTIASKQPTFDKIQAVFEDFYMLHEKVFAPLHRASAKIHPSVLAKECPRAAYFEFIGAVISNPENALIDPQLQRIFDVGTWWHTYIQNLLSKTGILIGREVPVISKTRRISGRADGVVQVDVLTLLEIKTMNSFQFNKLAEPLEEHRWQTALYADILNLDQVCFLYINKDTSGFKEFIEPLSYQHLRKANKKIKYILGAVKEEVAPDRICETRKDLAAKRCQFCDFCFSTRK